MQNQPPTPEHRPPHSKTSAEKPSPAEPRPEWLPDAKELEEMEFLMLTLFAPHTAYLANPHRFVAVLKRASPHLRTKQIQARLAVTAPDCLVADDFLRPLPEPGKPCP